MDTQELFYLTCCEVARLLRVSPKSVRRWCSRNQIEHVRRRLTPVGPVRYLIPREAALRKLERPAPGVAPRPVALVPHSPETLRLARELGLLSPAGE